MTPERVAELRIDALNAKYAGKEFTIPANETMEILDLAMNQLEPMVTPEMWKNLGRIEALAERTTSPVSGLTDEQQRQVEKCLRDGAIMGSVSDSTVDVVRAILAVGALHAQAPAAEPQVGTIGHTGQVTPAILDACAGAAVAAQPQPVAEQHARIEKAEREALIEFGTPLQKLGARLTELLDDDQWNEVEPWLLSIAASQQATEPGAYCYYCSECYSHSCPAHKPAAPAIQQPQDERAAFEAWAKYCGLRLDMATHQFAWEGWKARATAAEAKLEAIRQGVRECVGFGFDKDGPNWISRHQVLALFQPQPQADESGLPG